MTISLKDVLNLRWRPLEVKKQVIKYLANIVHFVLIGLTVGKV